LHKKDKKERRSQMRRRKMIATMRKVKPQIKISGRIKNASSAIKRGIRHPNAH
jgi:hypothetical protein